MTEASKTFADLGVEPAICRALEATGIHTPFPIQELTLPLALSRADVIGQARTGTGKTLAFGIPLLQAIDPGSTATQALVVVPTRELCLQVHDDLALTGKERGVSTVALYGGKAIEGQSTALDAGAQVVVGTPGRLLDLRRRGLLHLSQVSTLVLDEADEMLDMGFLPDVEQLIEACGSRRQTLLFSATMPSEVVGLARRYMSKPTFMRADVEEPQIAPGTRQVFLACHRLDKPAVLARILRAPDRGLTVVFTRTKRMADVLVSELAERGVTANAIHSNLRQDARERTLGRFRRGKVDVLCATEVAARGLDITDVTHVINYDCPDDEKMYLHRIGRTGRAGAGGVAVTLSVWNEQARLEMIKKALDIDEPTHEVFSTSPELDELFGIEPEASAAAGVSAAAEAGGEPGDAAAGERPARRRRSRSRRRSEPRPRDAGARRESPEGSASAAADRRASSSGDDRQEHAEDSDDAAGPPATGRERRRVRRRPATDRGAAGPEPPGGATDDGEAHADAAADAAPAPERPPRQPQDAAGAAPAAKQGRRRGGRRRKQTPGGGRDRSSQKRAPTAPAQPREAAEARGDGRPALNRPMTISHLP